jgi:uncharacterized membrane protein YkvA (DUF1232 family)
MESPYNGSVWRKDSSAAVTYFKRFLMAGKTLGKWKQWAKKLKIEVYALYLTYKDPRVPWYARVFAACVVGYAFSPIDLIPDPIPVLGYLDDLVLIPLRVAIALRMIPAEVMCECREKAKEIMAQGKPVNKMAAAVIIGIWVLLAVICVYFMLPFL